MSKYEDDLARELSVTQWEFLADHFEGRRPIYGRCTFWNEDRTRNSLLARKLIRVDPPANITPRPTHTVLTAKGHAVMCAALGLMADMLQANSFALDQEVAINDWFTLAPEYRTRDRLIEMVTRKPAEKYGYGKLPPAKMS